MDAVERQLSAYNAHDVDEFTECYATDVVLEDADGDQLLRGRDQLRTRYAQLFAESPDLHAEVLTRIQVGSFVVDEERVTGGPRGDVHAIAVYRLNADGLIDRVQFLR
jgi:hypothetical protein